MVNPGMTDHGSNYISAKFCCQGIAKLVFVAVSFHLNLTFFQPNVEKLKLTLKTHIQYQHFFIRFFTK